MCGNNGVTYRNKCHLQEATCRAGVQLAHVGPCADLQAEPDCPEDCKDQPESIVCASNGNVYSSVCQMKKETCGERVEVADLEKCQTTR